MIVSMPYLDPNSVDCNCAKSLKQEKMLRATTTDTSAMGAASELQRLSLSDKNEEDSSEEEEGQDQNVEEDFSDVCD